MRVKLEARAKAKKWREDLKLSQLAAGKRLKIPRTTVSAIERGTRKASLRDAQAYKREADIETSEWPT